MQTPSRAASLQPNGDDAASCEKGQTRLAPRITELVAGRAFAENVDAPPAGRFCGSRSERNVTGVSTRTRDPRRAAFEPTG